MINKVPLKKLIEFRRFSERKQAGFASRLKVPKKSSSEGDDGAGDYWISCTSCLANAFKVNDNEVVKEKIEVIAEKYRVQEYERTKQMYKRNIELLESYKNFDFSVLRPSHDLGSLPRPRTVLTIDGIPVEIRPDHVFSFISEEEERIGAISFVAWKEQFNREDLGAFSEAFFEYLTFVYSDRYDVDPNNCLTVEVSSANTVRYSQVLSGEIRSVLIPTIDQLNKYL